MPAGLITGIRGVDLGAPDVAAHARFDDFVIEYIAEVEKVGENHRVQEPREWAYPPGHSDLWGATPPPSARMKEAQKKIQFAAGLFRP